MAFLGSCILCLIPFSLLFGLCFSFANVSEFKLELSYKTLSPLGVPQQVIAVNGMFPGPVLNVTTSHLVNVTVTNKLDENLLITWAGLRMRRAFWQDGVLGTNCPIPLNHSWTYKFLVKDQIGSFFYFPSLNLQRSAGGFGSFIINNNLPRVPLPFDTPYGDIVVFIGDWYKQSHKALREALDNGTDLGIPDGVLINGKGPYSMAEPFDYEKINVVPGKTYRIRVHNIGVSTCLNFRIQNHELLLVETEGHYTAHQNNSSFDIHVGQSYSFLVTMNQDANSDYYIVASPKFMNPNQTYQWQNVIGVAILYYSELKGKAAGPLPTDPVPPNGVYNTSLAMEQSMSIRQDFNARGGGLSRQGAFNYSLLSSTELFILRSTQPITIDGKLRATFNGISFKNPGYPIRLADQFDKSKDVYNLDFPNATLPSGPPRIATSLVKGTYNHSMELILQNNDTVVLSFHMDGHSFFVLGMGLGEWTKNSTKLYNMNDTIWRSTVQVFPGGWTAVLIYLDNVGVWNLRAENLDRWYLGQETYMRVVDPLVDNATVFAYVPDNVLYCSDIENYTNPKSSIAKGVGHPKLYLTLLVVFSASISILC
ncbi:monocopper oxidase-like protein SKU5 isoform X1 [Rhododendron vialii]|uniref:monocopper oxidase-like protein SKU5 isoform X1 n=1 Tax=Rhododendron vialii TaxID=182163 RepID=UPI00265DD8F2|nr:monocopper oxidase-like protein SKU5 isoform X1 [Rhododendron vialii]